MTLKNLFSKRFWTRLLRRFTQFNWLTALWSVVLFFAFPVAGALLFSDGGSSYWTVARVSNTVVGQICFVCGATVLMAILTPNAFNYLNSRKELDFYHSQPVSRKELFWRNYLTGWMSFAIPLTAGFICETGIIMLLPGIAWENIAVLFKGYWTCMGTYFSVNALCLLAVMLCGNRFISLLTGVYLCGAPAMLFGMFWYYVHTFSATFRYEDIMEQILAGISPLAYIMDYAVSYYDGTGSQYLWGVICWPLISVGVLFLARALYLRRKSESAGKPLAFPKAIVFIKYPLTIFAAWIGGLLFDAMTNSAVWMLFAFVTFGVLTHCIISGLEKFEFRNAFRGWLKLLLCGGIFVTCLFITFIGCVMFDKRTTGDKNIVSIDLYTLRYSETYSEGDAYSISVDVNGIKGEEAIKALNEIARAGAKTVVTGGTRDNIYFTVNDDYYISVSEGDENSAYVNLYLRINTVAGSYIREYSFYTEANGDIEQAVKRFAYSAGAKKAWAEHLIDGFDEYLEYEKFTYRPTSLIPGKNKMKAVYEALKTDIANATADQYEADPIGEITLACSARFDSWSTQSSERTVVVPVYPFYTKTLEELGGVTEKLTSEYSCVGTYSKNYYYSSADYDKGYDTGYNDGYEKGKAHGEAGEEYYEYDAVYSSEYEYGYYDGYIVGYDEGYNMYGDSYGKGYKTGYKEGYASGKADLDGGYDKTLPDFDYNGTMYRDGYIQGFYEGYLTGYQGEEYTEPDIE